MLATLAARPFSDPDWVFEVKHDGVRVFAARTGGKVELYTRNRRLVTATYPEVSRAIASLPADRFLLDGEIVALDERGRSSFQRLQPRMHLLDARDVERAARAVPVTAFFFDCLCAEGRDLRHLPLADRKEATRLLVGRSGVLRYSDHVEREGERFYDLARKKGLEGIVAKRLASPYRGGRSRDWLKIKCQLRQEFVIGGYTDPRGGRSCFGALHLGLYEGGKLVYVSKVGTGFDERSLRAIWQKLRPLERPSPPFDTGAPEGRGHHWVEPKLVCEVRFTEWTADGGIRHPTFLGLRDDKDPRECRREAPVRP
jgi:bifunctional non-homologous end joining protein LigD